MSGARRGVPPGLRSASRPVASGLGSRAATREGLLSLPATAQGPVSAALGSEDAAYRIKGLVAHNPAQRLSARFGRSGVAITASSARFAISLKAFGRGGALRALTAVSPVAGADRVSYAHGSLREWWSNGPLGLEQGFDIARRPAGSGALTFSLAVPASARLDHGTVLLPGGLRYAACRPAMPAVVLCTHGSRCATGASLCGGGRSRRALPGTGRPVRSAVGGADCIGCCRGRCSRQLGRGIGQHRRRWRPAPEVPPALRVEHRQRPGRCVCVPDGRRRLGPDRQAHRTGRSRRRARLVGRDLGQHDRRRRTGPLERVESL
jgi:hypothetical protein